MKKCNKCQRDVGASNSYELRHKTGRVYLTCKWCADRYSVLWRKKNAERARELKKRWSSVNLEYFREYAKKQNASNPKWRINTRLRVAVNDVIKYGWKLGKWEKYLGYSTEEFRERIESLFREGMGWENHGEWHIDHIKPIWKFEFSSEEDEGFRRCWALANLQPLWAEENFKKNRTYKEL